MDDSTVWDKVASAVARKTGATILTYDRAGLGKSEPVPGPYKIDNEVTALDRALRSMKLEPLIIVAHSYGGFLAALFSSEHQQQIRGVILIDANLASFFTDERSFQIDGRLGWRTRRVAKSWCGKGESAGCVARDGAANAQCRIPEEPRDAHVRVFFSRSAGTDTWSCDLVENPAVGADILHRRGQFDPQLWIALRDDCVGVDLPLGRSFRQITSPLPRQ
jgi:pimeloyl-ACP methyl ester carboxylesterase